MTIAKKRHPQHRLTGARCAGFFCQKIQKNACYYPTVRYNKTMTSINTIQAHLAAALRYTSYYGTLINLILGA